MIVRNDREQWIGCDICEECVELSRAQVADSEAMMIRVENMRQDHRSCLRFRHDPARMKNELGVNRRLRLEFEKMADRKKFRRP